MILFISGVEMRLSLCYYIHQNKRHGALAQLVAQAIGKPAPRVKQISKAESSAKPHR